MVRVPGAPRVRAEMSSQQSDVSDGLQRWLQALDTGLLGAGLLWLLFLRGGCMQLQEGANLLFQAEQPTGCRAPL